MSGDDARAQIAAIVGPDVMPVLDALAALVVDENGRQNLIARSTVASLWSRHMLDSIQLLTHARDDGTWLDIGTGGGFPGLAVAAASPRPVVLVEPRRRRAEFLRAAADRLGLSNVTVHAARVENVAVAAATISARAVAPIEKLLQAAHHCATPQTRWLFLRGRPATREIDELRVNTGMVFHVEQSLSDPASSIVIAETKHR